MSADIFLSDTTEKYCKCPDEESCLCGEATKFEWTWDEESILVEPIKMSKKNREIKFHPSYSSGTTGVRGTKFLEENKHHYWEIKMITQVYGTDIMVGVGTKKAKLSAQHRFLSLLGMDKESWGFSYKGYIQHEGKMRKYSEPFGEGCLVGVHYDSWRGIIRFFVNRQSLGIAFIGLRNLVLYPMVCSTVANSIVRLSQSLSTPASLEIACLKALKTKQLDYLTTMYPGLCHLTKSIFTHILRQSSDEEENENEDEYEFQRQNLILDDFDFVLVGLAKRKSKPNLFTT